MQKADFFFLPGYFFFKSKTSLITNQGLHYSKKSFRSSDNLWSFCPLFFINLLFFYQMVACQKIWKMLFISFKKLFSFLKYSNFCNFFPFLSILFRIKRTNGSGIIYDVMNWLAEICKCNFRNNSKNRFISYHQTWSDNI